MRKLIEELMIARYRATKSANHWKTSFFESTLFHFHILTTIRPNPTDMLKNLYSDTDFLVDTFYQLTRPNYFCHLTFKSSTSFQFWDSLGFQGANQTKVQNIPDTKIPTPFAFSVSQVYFDKRDLAEKKFWAPPNAFTILAFLCKRFCLDLWDLKNLFQK